MNYLDKFQTYVKSIFKKERKLPTEILYKQIWGEDYANFIENHESSDFSNFELKDIITFIKKYNEKFPCRHTKGKCVSCPDIDVTFLKRNNNNDQNVNTFGIIINRGTIKLIKVIKYTDEYFIIKSIFDPSSTYERTYLADTIDGVKQFIIKYASYSSKFSKI
jgi:hypothetical protein